MLQAGAKLIFFTAKIDETKKLIKESYRFSADEPSIKLVDTAKKAECAILECLVEDRRSFLYGKQREQFFKDFGLEDLIRTNALNNNELDKLVGKIAYFELYRSLIDNDKKSI